MTSPQISTRLTAILVEQFGIDPETLVEAISYSHPNRPDGPRDGIIYK